MELCTTIYLVADPQNGSVERQLELEKSAAVRRLVLLLLLTIEFTVTK